MSDWLAGIPPNVQVGREEETKSEKACPPFHCPQWRCCILLIKLCCPCPTSIFLPSSPSNSGTPFQPRQSSLFSINCDFFHSLLPDKWSPLLSYRNCHLPKRAKIQPSCMLTLWFMEDQPLLQQFCEGRPVEGDCSFVSQPHRPILSHRDYINNSTV